ncbi:MAG TPA: hypothetical protein VIL20_02720, partial [Sandaracinaceae bacterium]
LPEKPVPPRRAYPEDGDAVALLEMEIDPDDDGVEVTVLSDPEDDDAPEIEIAEAKPASGVGSRAKKPRKPRPDETIVAKNPRRTVE